MKIHPFFAILPIFLLLAACASTERTMPTEGGDLARVDADAGLPDARIGTPLSEFSGLELGEDAGSFLTFRRPTDPNKIGRWPVQEILYNFYDKKLYSIQVAVDDERSTKGILRDLYARYGEPTNTTRREYQDTRSGLVILEWDGRKNGVVYKYAKDFEGGEITYLDVQLWERFAGAGVRERKALQGALEGSIMNLDFD